MTLGNLDHSTAPLFHQGASVTARLAFFAALSLSLVALDVRYHLTPPLRQTLMVMLSPFELVARAPFELLGNASSHFQQTEALQQENQKLRHELLELGVRAQEAAALARDNRQLRALLAMRENEPRRSLIAELLNESANPFGRKIAINIGLEHGVQRGSPVADEAGVLGQVTNVYELGAEVTLLTDKNATTPVEIERNGLRTVAQGSAEMLSDLVELRLLATNADVRLGDRVITSGLDGVYPRGLEVGSVSKVDRQLNSVFARFTVTPSAGVARGRYVLVLEPPSGHSSPVHVTPGNATSTRPVPAASTAPAPSNASAPSTTSTTSTTAGRMKSPTR